MIGETESISVVRYSIGWRGSAERGMWVGGVAAEDDCDTRLPEARGAPMCDCAFGVEGPRSERRRRRWGKAGFACGAGAVRRNVRISSTC